MKIKYLPFLLFAIVTTSHGEVKASFSCSRAKTTTEHTICKNSELKALDSQVAALYWKRENARTEGMAWREVQDSQRDWLQSRNACGSNISCLRASYYRRLNELENLSQ